MTLKWQCGPLQRAADTERFPVCSDSVLELLFSGLSEVRQAKRGLLDVENEPGPLGLEGECVLVDRAHRFVTFERDCSWRPRSGCVWTHCSTRTTSKLDEGTMGFGYPKGIFG